MELIANAFSVRPRYRVLSRRMLRIAGWFDTTIRELDEMLYQYQFDYVFDSTKFANAFCLHPTSLFRRSAKNRKRLPDNVTPGS